jgi:hypothetical protein
MIKKLTGILAAASALFLVGSSAAVAASPEPFTITEVVDFNSTEAPTFTTGGALNGDTFSAQKHVLIAFNEEGSFTNTGPITLHRGTGAFTELSGHGVDNGTATADGFGIGIISGVLNLN